MTIFFGCNSSPIFDSISSKNALLAKKMTGAVFQIKVSAEFVLKQFSEVSGLDGCSGSLSIIQSCHKSIPKTMLYSIALLQWQRLSWSNAGQRAVVLNVSR